MIRALDKKFACLFGLVAFDWHNLMVDSAVSYQFFLTIHKENAMRWQLTF